MKRILICVLLLCLFVGCTQKEAMSDMSGYAGFTDQEHVFLDAEPSDIHKMMEEGKTFVVYFGFAKCPWCIEAIGLLNDTAKSADMHVYYVDTRKDSSWTSNIDIDDYDIVVEMFGDYFDYDDNGIKHLYTPHVFFVKDGDVVFEHQGTVEGHDATERQMDSKEIQQLSNIYAEGFAKLQ